MASPANDARDRQARGLCHDEPQDVAALRPEGDPNANLAGSALDRPGQHAEGPHRGDDERHESEDAEEHRREAGTGSGIVHGALERGDAG